MAHLLLPVLLAIGLASCGQIPRPFELGDKQVNPLLVPPEGGELLVRHPTGLPSRLDDGGAALLAEGLTRGGVRSSARERSALGADLSIHVASRPVDSRHERLFLSWEVYSPSGVLRGSARQDRVVPTGAWAEGDPRLLRALAQEAAPQLAHFVSGSEPNVREFTWAPKTGPPLPEMAVGVIEGAPGNGNVALGEALVMLLAQQGIRLLRKPSPDRLMVEGRIEMGPIKGGQQLATLTWTVKDGLDGEVLGSVTQQNPVPAGSLDRDWGQAAFLAGQGAVEGIVSVLKRKKRL
ncbi:MAG: hypothetical protein GDA41_07635 [Rhodospirillales bacterium]|nr:hypothetical protein [Rhodospirillales bacterium]